jgi:AcrR family transcriptional regulator
MFVKMNVNIPRFLDGVLIPMAENTPNSSKMRRKPRQARSQERVNRILDVAEELFVEEGYGATTTNAIASRAKVPIGSLYQFFPDKSAIVQALATRYCEQLHQKLTTLNLPEMASLPLPIYVDRIIDETVQFFAQHPGYHAIFMEVQGTIPELEKIENAADAQLIQDFAASLTQRNAELTETDRDAIALVLVKAIGTLLWLSLSQEPAVRQRLVAETKRLTLHYLQSYFASENPAEEDFPQDSES